jgi:hypothetical protein
MKALLHALQLELVDKNINDDSETNPLMLELKSKDEEYLDEKMEIQPVNTMTAEMQSVLDEALVRGLRAAIIYKASTHQHALTGL